MTTDYHGAEARRDTEEVDEASDGRLRSAMLQDGQPALTWWLPFPGVVLALIWAAYQAVSAQDGAGAEFLGTLLWPGAAIFVLTTVTAYFGWRLDLD